MSVLIVGKVREEVIREWLKTDDAEIAMAKTLHEYGWDHVNMSGEHDWDGHVTAAMELLEGFRYFLGWADRPEEE